MNRTELNERLKALDKAIKEKDPIHPLVHEIQRMNEKMDKLHSFLDSLIKNDQDMIVKPIQIHHEELATNHFVELYKKLNIIESQISALLHYQRKQPCKKKKSTKSRNRKKISTGSRTTPASKPTFSKRLKNYWLGLSPESAQTVD